MLLDVGGWGISEYSGRPIFVFLSKKIGFEPWLDNMLRIYYWQEIFLLPLTSYSEAIIKIMIPLHCLCAKSNYRASGQFECDMTLFLLFMFWFLHSHARCGFCFIVCLSFQDVQIKRVDYKMSTKNVNNFKYFLIFLDNCTHNNIKPRKSR